MNGTCIKCGCRRISGPHYDANYFNASGYGVGERLVYRCAQCGYEWTEPTRDEASRTDAPRGVAHRRAEGIVSHATGEAAFFGAFCFCATAAVASLCLIPWATFSVPVKAAFAVWNLFWFCVNVRGARSSWREYVRIQDAQRSGT